MPTERRDVGVVFQSYALFPHLTVRDNIAFGLQDRPPPALAAQLAAAPRRATRLEARVWDTAALLGLERLLDRKPAQLSGGEQQRVAARPRGGAAARRCCSSTSRSRPSTPACAAPCAPSSPRCCASSAPPSSTSPTTRRRRCCSPITWWCSTRAGWCRPGPPLDLYRRPATPFVASFLGEANLVEVSVEDRRDGKPARTPLGRLALPAGACRGLGPGAPRGRDRGPAGRRRHRRGRARAGPPRPRPAGTGERRRAARPLPARSARRSRARRSASALRSREPHFLAEA